MIDHMAMVFAADGEKLGLKSRHKLLLLAYANHSDAHGYCWPGIERLADETAMSKSTVQQVNAELRKLKLIKSVNRYDRVTGRQITNATRLNVALLASLRREETHYRDNLIEEITFGDEDRDPITGEFPQVNRGSGFHTPGAQISDPQGSGFHTPEGPESGPKTSEEPSVEPPPPLPPSHTGPASAGAGAAEAPAARGEGEGSPGGTDSPPAGPGGAVPSPRAAADDHGQALEEERLGAARLLLERLPAPVTPGARTVRDLAPAVAAALAAGWTRETLTAQLAADLPATVHSARALLTHRLEDLPPAPPAVPSRPSLPPRCDAPGHDPMAPHDRLLYEPGRAPRRCPACHPAALASNGAA